jgi:quercetin dioxygenase-like cupin family protein
MLHKYGIMLVKKNHIYGFRRDKMNTIIKHQKDIEFVKNPMHKDVYIKALTKNDENGRFSSHLVTVKPQGEIVPHTHEVVEVFYIMKGIGSALINGERIKAEQGSVIIAPAGSLHGLINEGNENIELYAVFSPGVV